MKKLKLFSLILLLLSCGLCLFACKEKQPIKLMKPISIGYVVNFNEDTNENEILLVTDKNPKAYKYEFFISDTAGQDKNYVSYLSDTNYLNVSNIFEDKKVYNFYVKYIGQGRYLDSVQSNIETYTPEKETLTEPTLHIINTNLTWFRIQNATGYEVYESVSGKATIAEHKVATLNASTFTFDISNLPNLNDINAPYNIYTYKVKAITNNSYYNNSNLSNGVEFIKEITLNKPSNLNVVKQDNEFTLSWGEVDYATGYEVVINNLTIINTSSTSLDISNYITNYAEYNFTVKANISDANKYNESEVSNKYTYTYTVKIDAPTNLQAVRNGEYIDISFTEPTFKHPDKLSYTLIILCDNNEIFYDCNLETSTRQVAVSNLVGLTSNNIVISIKANAFGNYILASDSVEINFTIEN